MNPFPLLSGFFYIVQIVVNINSLICQSDICIVVFFLLYFIEFVIYLPFCSEIWQFSELWHFRVYFNFNEVAPIFYSRYGRIFIKSQNIGLKFP